jgi:cell wall-associated NlpC family hydrolase
MRRVRLVRPAAVLSVAAVLLAAAVVASPAYASTRPVVTKLSRHRGPYWGSTQVTVRGANFVDVGRVLFEKESAWIQSVTPTKIVVIAPWHAYGTVHVRVVSASGTSRRSKADLYSFVPPTMNTPIQGGLTARQEQHISARVRAGHHGVRTAPGAGHWTAAMGLTAVHRARSWLGLPYSWAGGSYGGPTLGVCAHNGGDLDCHVVGFDCSGLALYSWSPYIHLVHYAQTQHAQAGRFHPTVEQLVPGDLVFFGGGQATGIGHVVVYAGHGTVIQAPESGSLVERSSLADLISWDSYRGSTRPMSTGRQAPGPLVTSLTPQLRLTGGMLVIRGRHLASATSVSVGGTLVYSFVRRTQRQLVVRAPAHDAGTVSVDVSNPWGTVTRPLTYVAPPTITSLSPATGPTAGGTTVQIAASGAGSVTAVRVAGTSVPFGRSGAAELTIVTPAHAARTVNIVLVSPFGRSQPAQFTYVAPPPARARRHHAKRHARAALRRHHRRTVRAGSSR